MELGIDTGYWDGGLILTTGMGDWYCLFERGLILSTEIGD